VHEQLARVQYDVVVLDEWAMASAATCELHGVPYAILVHSIPILRWWPGRPCPGTGRRRSSDAAEDERLAREMYRLVDATWLELMNEFRTSIGLDGGLAHVTDAEDRAALVLVLTTPAFDHATDAAPPNYRYVGPCVPIGLDDDAAESLLAALPADRPLVVMSPTTTSMAVGQADFVRASIEALSSLPVNGVVTVGRSLDPSAFEGTDNVHVVGHIAHGPLLRRASAMITHCGHGTTMTALHFGVPLVGLPDFADQRDIAARLVDFGLGVTLEKPASAPAIRAAVESVLGNPAFAARAGDFAEVLAREDGPTRAADELERVALES
jgi:MGT family glycosyltransferase